MIEMKVSRSLSCEGGRGRLNEHKRTTGAGRAVLESVAASLTGADGMPDEFAALPLQDRVVGSEQLITAELDQKKVKAGKLIQPVVV